MYWRGTDNDGVVTRYMWYLSDTLMTLDPEGQSRRGGARLESRSENRRLFEGKVHDTDRYGYHVHGIRRDEGLADQSPGVPHRRDRRRREYRSDARPAAIPRARQGNSHRAVLDERRERRRAVQSQRARYDQHVRALHDQIQGATVNNIITGYRWSYGSLVFPDYNGDGTPDWLIPAEQSEIGER